ncbi:ABC transporter permease subunit [Anaerocolumna sp. AGMB13025]|uniref:ABC transporter permease n=1 Tax=Anaerocolumna sp. AGMB13025 TaxID=3039116 RepID=UPI00241D67D0|nr:ABC transporter permease subunit [Anaerocolumna sp. AGMB13025]WFR58027.1 ABC transporter permease subunit [Anaerocolumna sp. AGMB13025]
MGMFKKAIDSVPIRSQTSVASKNRSIWNYILRKRYLYLMLIPAIIYFLVFNYAPMYGILIAFKDFSFKKGIWGSEWIGLENFRYMFQLDNFYTVFKNSILLSLLRILFTFPIPIFLALLLNDIKSSKYQKVMQTLFYLPHFVSWVVIGGILINFLSPVSGIINILIQSLGGEPIFFLAENKYFKPIVILTSIWKDSGWGTIIYLAAITGISSDLYEAAKIDGANKLKCLKYITLPSIKSTVVIMLILRLGSIMNNGFEQIFILQNSKNLGVSEVFETYTYRLGLLGGRYSFATTVGLFTSVIGIIFLLASNKIANKMGEEGIW